MEAPAAVLGRCLCLKLQICASPAFLLAGMFSDAPAARARIARTLPAVCIMKCLYGERYAIRSKASFGLRYLPPDSGNVRQPCRHGVQ